MAETPNKEMLIDAIGYQNCSIVSKQILKKPNGNITLFAFDKDESLTEHTSPYEAVVYMVDGEMEIKIGGNPYLSLIHIFIQQLQIRLMKIILRL